VIAVNKDITEAEVVLSAQSLHKSYKNMEALTDFSCAMRAGEIIGLLGPNGAGKTTAMRILSTIFPPDRGDFSVMGIPHTRTEEIRSLIGVLPESMGFPMYMTGEEYLTYMGRLYGLSPQAAETKAMELLTLFGLAIAADSQIATYSRGMRQRLGIARTFVNDPKLLFLDEPTLGFDPKGQREMLQVVKNAAAVNRVAVMISSHQLEVIEEICSQVLILNRGRLVAAGKISDIKQKIPTLPACRIEVSPGTMQRALEILTRMEDIKIEREPSQQNEILVSMHGGDGTNTVNAILQSLTQAGVSIESFTRERVSLSDAFLSMIEEVQA
jgi:ABC-2 type transport system ATP-binding protein